MDGWICPKFMHKFKSTLILFQCLVCEPIYKYSKLKIIGNQLLKWFKHKQTNKKKKKEKRISWRPLCEPKKSLKPRI